MRGFWRRLARLAWTRTIPREAFLRSTMHLLAKRASDTGVQATLENPEIRFLGQILTHGAASRAQIFQDIWALRETGFKRGGFFVEFGATDGLSLSNTHLLEKSYGWTGILAEPNPVWHEDLRKNRACAISTKCVAARSGETVPFLAASAPELGTLARLAPADQHAGARREGRTIQVETISLDDLLRTHGAPRDIDFMSVDTEGSELEILGAFDFSAWNVRLLAVEHNGTDAERQLDQLLTGKGYRRVLPALSWFDAWYVKS